MFKRLIFLTTFVLVLSLVSNAGAQGTGTIMREVWEGIGGTSVSDLTGNANYPDNPSYGDLVTLFEAPTDFADNFGSRLHGYLHPETSGDYTFWIAADDFCDLLLSTSDSPADAVKIAGHESWTGSRAWDSMESQKSEPVSLVAGEKYYISALYKEGGGGDNMSVAWEGPDCPARDVIDGYFLSPAPWAAVLLKASAPNPADGAVDADVATLEWAPGPSAVSHKVYLSTDETIDESDLAAETEMTMHFAALDPGAAYYWRVDEVDADGAVIEGNLWSFTTLPMEAHFPSPSDGAKGIESGIKLSWAPGKNTIMHNVSFGTDPAALIPVSMMQMDTSYDPGPLEQFTTYYWKVDEFTPVGTVDGPLWSFSMAEYVIIDSEETTLDYDNSVEPYLSEVALDTPAELTTKGVSDLSLRFHGAPGPEGSSSLDEATGTYTIVGSGADIWGNSDQFHYAYRELTGDATMIARVADNGSGTNEWAKGGVMIRQSLDAGSTHRYMPITAGGGNGASFQGRPVADAASNNVDSGEVVAPPYWVKLERVGNDFTGSISPDGITWTQLGGAETVEMTDPVLIGLAVTSHQSGEKRTFTFDNVDIVGNISADDASTDIGIASNSAEPIYAVLEDSAGVTGVVAHPDPAATRIDQWWTWKIPLSEFAGVDLTAAAKLYIGVGDVANPTAGGSGTIRIDDIRVVKPATAANIIWVSGTFDDNGDGAPDDQGWVDLLEAQGHTVDYTGTYWRTLDDDKIAALNAADLIIVSRNSNSGDYDEGDEPTQWNSVTTPIINSSTHIIRSSRWKWVDSTSIPNVTPLMDVLLCDDPLCEGVPFQVSVLDAAMGQTSFIDSPAGNGTVSATGDGLPWIIEWEAGVEFYDGAGQIAGGPRMFFAAGTQEDTAAGVGRGEMNLTPAGVTIFLNAVNKMLVKSPLDSWAAEAVSAAPGFLAVKIADGVYDIGEFSGDITYEFVVCSNPDETEASMCLIGRRQYGDTEAGLKYEQWNNTGTYGATLFGVVDLDFGIATNPGVDTHLVFVSSEDAATTDLYVNGVYQASVDRAITLSGLVGIGYGAQGADASGVFDDFDGDIYGVAIYDTALSDDEIMARSDAYLSLPDVTAPGDNIKGVPDDGDWPGGEPPAFAIDDNTGTKYLHFKGDFDPDPGTGGTGFQVEVSAGASIVTGMTFTTANDSPPRDPVAFELSGSNGSINGPYDLIAVGDIVDFNQEAECPRFTRNATPISFENDVAYKYYQVLFTAIRDAPNANSMQIAEVELLGVLAP